MKNTVTLSQLITRLAETAKIDNNTSRRFIKALFDTITRQLEAGETVEIKGVGTFEAVDRDGRRSVTFTPDAALAAELNRPFEMFQAVELAPDVDFDAEMPEEATESAEPSESSENSENSENSEHSEHSESSENSEHSEHSEHSESSENSESSEHSESSEPSEEPQPVSWVAATPVPFPAPPGAQTEPYEADNAPAEDPEEVPAAQPGKRFWIWAVVGLLVAIGIGYAAAVFYVPVTPQPRTETVEEPLPAPEEVDPATLAPATPSPEAEASVTAPVAETTAKPAPVADTAEQPAAASKAEPVYDTVEVSLIRLAKKHYGENLFWVYIYEANTDVIHNPNTIRPGTRVVIPDRSTFPGATPQDARDLAKKKQSEILSRF